jgi:hypothetical protein
MSVTTATFSPPKSDRDLAREALARAERAEHALAYYADADNYNEDGAPTYLNLSAPVGWVGEGYEAQTTLDEGRLARQTLADVSFFAECEHTWGPWEDDVAGLVRECSACGADDFRPEG